MLKNAGCSGWHSSLSPLLLPMLNFRALFTYNLVVGTSATNFVSFVVFTICLMISRATHATCFHDFMILFLLHTPELLRW